MPPIQRKMERKPLPNGRVQITYTQKIDPAHWNKINDRAQAAHQDRNQRRKELIQGLIDIDMEEHNERINPPNGETP